MRFAKLVTLAVIAGMGASAAGAAVRRDDPATIRGADYVPYDAYNAPQFWQKFDLKEVRRDFGYAREIHLNALRMWASYEFWQRNPDRFGARFDQLLAAAHDDGIRVLISLFEQDGVAPTAAHMASTDPATALDIQSPGDAVTLADKAGWEAPRGFLAWFMKRYKNDDRLLAIEVMNEPGVGPEGLPGAVPFAQSMFRTAKNMQGTVPLTIGSDRIEIAAMFVPLGLDVVEYHVNFPKSDEELIRTTKAALAFGAKNNLPVWLTEWQRTRMGAGGFGAGETIDPAERLPDYASMAATVRQYPVGSFFWCLMVKRAYLGGQRRNGTVNGLFWPDGTVESVKDARAIADDPTLTLREKPIAADFGMEAVGSKGTR